jgi:hypothetical protein
LLVSRLLMHVNILSVIVFFSLNFSYVDMFLFFKKICII